jgi:hypothetical protein
LYEWLNRAFAAGSVARVGAGTRTNPYRYSLPGAAPRRLTDLRPLW